MVLGPSHGAIKVNGKRLGATQQVALYQRLSLLDILGQQYWIQTLLDTLEDKRMYLAALSHVRSKVYGGIRLTEIAGVPSYLDVVNPHAIYHQKVAKTDTGYMLEGYNVQNGDLRSIERTCVDDEEQHQKLMLKIKVLNLVRDGPGIVTIFDYFTLHGETEFVNSIPPYDFDVIKDKGIDFVKYDWSSTEYETQRRMVKDLLMFMNTFHSEGLVHRAINPETIEVFGQPPRAGFADVGDLKPNPHDHQIRAKLSDLPVEVKSLHHLSAYTTRGDVWQTGRTLALCWFKNICRTFGDDLNIRDQEIHARFIQDLQQQECPLADMIVRMLEWDVSKRPTAAELIKDNLFAPRPEKVLKKARSNMALDTATLPQSINETQAPHASHQSQTTTGNRFGPIQQPSTATASATTSTRTWAEVARGSTARQKT